MCTTTTRSDGLLVGTMPLNTPTVTLVLYVRAGARMEPEGKGGLAHLVEHLVLSQVDEHDGLTIVDVIENHGGTVQAATEKELTRFELRIPVSEWRLGLTSLMKRLIGINVGRDSLEAARTEIVNEIMNAGATGPYGVQTMLEQAVWGGHPLSRSPFGSLNGLLSVTPADVERFYALYYRPSQCILTAAGPVGHEELLCALDPALPEVREARSELAVPEAPVTRTKCVMWLGHRSAADYLALGFPGPGCRQPETFYWSLLNFLLVFNSRARLIEPLRQSMGTFTNITGEVKEYSDASLLAIRGRASALRSEQSLQAIFGALQSLAETGVDEAEYNRVQALYRHSVLVGLESSRSAALWAGNSLMRHGRIRAVEEILASAEAISLAEFNERLTALCSPSSVAIVVGAPRSDWSSLDGFTEVGPAVHATESPVA